MKEGGRPRVTFEGGHNQIWLCSPSKDKPPPTDPLPAGQGGQAWPRGLADAAAWPVATGRGSGWLRVKDEDGGWVSYIYIFIYIIFFLYCRSPPGFRTCPKPQTVSVLGRRASGFPPRPRREGPSSQGSVSLVLQAPGETHSLQESPQASAQPSRSCLVPPNQSHLPFVGRRWPRDFWGRPRALLSFWKGLCRKSVLGTGRPGEKEIHP